MASASISDDGAHAAPRLEQTLLYWCARAGASLEAVSASAAESLDWQYLLERADAHFVTELLYEPLKSACDAEASGASSVSPPADILATLERRFFEATGANLARTRQLGALLDRMHARGIDALAFKGPTLAAQFYGHLGRRSAGDLDLLIDHRHAAAARELLLSDGYTLPPPRPRRVGSLLHGLYAGAGRDDTLVAPDTRHADIDLHVDFAFWVQGIRLDMRALFARAMAVTVAGMRIPTLCPEDVLLVLSIHGMMHGWSVLRHVSDIDAVCRHVGDWDEVLRRARSARMQRVLSVALLLAEELLRTPVPRQILTAARRDDAAVAITRSITSRLFDPPRELIDRWDPQPWFLLFQDRTRDRLRFHMRTLIYEWFLKWPWDEWLGRRRAAQAVNEA